MSFEQERQKVEQTYQGQLAQLLGQQREAQQQVQKEAREHLGAVERQKQQVLEELYKQEELSRRQVALGKPYIPLAADKGEIERKAVSLQEATKEEREKALEAIGKQVETGKTELEAWKSGALTEVEKAEQQWATANVQLQTGEWVPKEDFNTLPLEYQTKLMKLGVDQFNVVVEVEQKQFEAENVQLKTGEWTLRVTYEALSDEDKSLLNKVGITEYLKLFETENIQLSTSEWTSKESFEALSLEQQSLLMSAGIDEFNRQQEAELTRFKADNIEVRPNEWYARSLWEALNPRQQEQVLETGRYTVPPRIQVEVASTEPDSELAKLPPVFAGIATAAAGAIAFPEPISSAAGGVVLAVLAAIITYATARGIIEADIDWGRAFGELRTKVTDVFTTERSAGTDVPTTKVETRPETGTIEITPAQTSVDGQIQTFVLEQQQMLDIMTQFPLEQIRMSDIMTKLPLDQATIADAMTKFPLEQATLADAITTFPIIQQRIGDIITTFPLIQQQLEDTIMKSVAVATAARGVISSIPSLQSILTAEEMSGLSTIRERYLSTMHDTIRSPDATTRGELYTYMSDARVAIHQIIDQLLEAGRINQAQHEMYLEQLRTGERSEKELLEWLEQYFLNVRETQSLLESYAPQGASPELRSRVAAAMLTLLTQLYSLPKSEPSDTVGGYATSSIIIPQITSIVATPVVTEVTIATLTDVATKAAIQAVSEATAQGLTITQAMPSIEVAAQTAALAVTAPMIATATMTETAVNTAVRTAVNTAVREATRVAEAQLTRVRRLPLPKTVEDLKKPPEKTSVVPAGTYTWRQGFVWKWFPPPYDAKKPYTSFAPPIGAVNTNLRTPAETIQIIRPTGKEPKSVSIDLGVTDIFITTNPLKIRFGGKGLKTDVGTRIPVPERGLSIPQIKTPRLILGPIELSPIEFNGAKPKHKGGNRPELHGVE